MNKATFLIVLTRDDVTNGTNLKQGDVLEAQADGRVFDTEFGEFYKNEARIVNALEMITYAHKDNPAGCRYRQMAADPIPPWAGDVKLDEGDKVEPVPEKTSLVRYIVRYTDPYIAGEYHCAGLPNDPCDIENAMLLSKKALDALLKNGKGRTPKNYAHEIITVKCSIGD